METETENKRHTEENLRPAEAMDQKAGSEPAKYSEDGTNADEQGQCDKLVAELLKQALSLLNSTNAMIWSANPERFGLVTSNTALEKYFFKGLGIKIKVGMTPDDLLSAGVAAQWLGFYRQALRDGSYVREYSTFATTNYLLLLGPPKRYGEVLGISVFGKDITELKHG